MVTLRNRNDIKAALSRRSFLVVTAGAGLAFGFLPSAEAAMDPAAKGGVPPKLNGPTFEPTIWFSMDADGMVTVNIIRAEMGQHVGTALARILADELEVPWSKVRITHVDTDPKWGLMVTGGSLVGLADLADLQPGRGGGPDGADRGRRQAARRIGF